MPITPEMKEFLKGTTTLAVFLKISPRDGSTPIRVWNGTRNKILGGETYVAYPLSPSKLQQSAGLKADNLEIAASYAASFTAATLRARKWEGARVEYAVYNYKDFTMGYAERRTGFLGRTEVGKFGAKPEMVSLSAKLNQTVGRSFNAECDVVELGDPRCGVALTGFTTDGFRVKTTASVSAVANRQQFTVEFTEPMQQGLRARYYSGADFDTLYTERIDPKIDYDFGENPPIVGMAFDNFSLRWEGTIKPLYSETYTFSVEHDDGVRLWVNNLATPLIDQWGTLGTHTATIALTAGTAYDFKLEYNDIASVGKIKLRWSSTSQASQIVPNSAFAPAGGLNAAFDNIYHRGKAAFLSGPNTDFTAQVLANTGNALTLYLPLFYTPEIGDTVELTTGCDRTMANCRDRYSNGINHRGYPGIPGSSRLFALPED